MISLNASKIIWGHFLLLLTFNISEIFFNSTLSGL